MLHDHGFASLGPVLPGHSTTAADLARTTAADYFEMAERSFAEASERFSRVYLAGLSLGGLLSLHLNTKHDVSGIICLSTPVFLDPLVAGALPMLSRWIPDMHVPANFAAWQGNVVGYKTVPFNAAPAVLAMLATVKNELHKVHAPLLIIHSKGDVTAPIGNAEYIRDHVGSSDARIEVLEGYDHLITVGERLLRFQDRIIGFLRRLESSQA
jgi:carboxylesterase